jgi:hypothetical protein
MPVYGQPSDDSAQVGRELGIGAAAFAQSSQDAGESLRDDVLSLVAVVGNDTSNPGCVVDVASV